MSPGNHGLGQTLTEYTPGIEIRTQELAISLETSFGCKAVHVGARHQLIQEIPEALCFAVDVNLILPLKLSPHGPELRLRACGRLDVVHDINMEVVEDDNICIG